MRRRERPRGSGRLPWGKMDVRFMLDRSYERSRRKFTRKLRRAEFFLLLPVLSMMSIAHWRDCGRSVCLVGLSGGGRLVCARGADEVHEEAIGAGVAFGQLAEKGEAGVDVGAQAKACVD